MKVRFGLQLFLQVEPTEYSSIQTALKEATKFHLAGHLVLQQPRPSTCYFKTTWMTVVQEWYDLTLSITRHTYPDPRNYALRAPNFWPDDGPARLFTNAGFKLALVRLTKAKAARANNVVAWPVRTHDCEGRICSQIMQY